MRTLAAAFSLLLASCAAPAPAGDFTTLGPDLEPLRAAFDAAHGQVRAIVLASPS